MIRLGNRRNWEPGFFRHASLKTADRAIAHHRAGERSVVFRTKDDWAESHMQIASLAANSRIAANFVWNLVSIIWIVSSFCWRALAVEFLIRWLQSGWLQGNTEKLSAKTFKPFETFSSRISLAANKERTVKIRRRCEDGCLNLKVWNKCLPNY